MVSAESVAVVDAVVETAVVETAVVEVVADAAMIAEMTAAMIAVEKTPAADVDAETVDEKSAGTNVPRAVRRLPPRTRRWRPRPKQRTQVASVAASAKTQRRHRGKREPPSR
jgi:hypothetical protein